MRKMISTSIVATGLLICLAGCAAVAGFGQDVTHAADKAAEWGRQIEHAGTPVDDPVRDPHGSDPHQH